MRARIISMVVLAASLLVASQALAQSDGAATFGGQWWSQTNPDASYQQYRDLARGGYLQDYVLREFNGPYAGALWGNDALTRNQGNGFYLAKGVTWRLDAKYTETPHNVSFITRSPWAQVAPGVFALPDAVQRQNRAWNVAKDYTDLNSYFRNLYASSEGTPLGVQTDVSQARLRLRPIKEWQFEVKGTQRERSGTQAYGATFGMSPDPELPIPINQRTLDVDVLGSYAHGPAKVMASVGVSDFHNDVPTLTWDNPLVLRDSSYFSSGKVTGIGSQGRMALAPDNRTVRGTAAFSVKLPYRSTFTATLGISQTTQEQAFIPITINSAQWGGALSAPGVASTDSIAGLKANSLSALPASNLGGKVSAVTQDYRLTGRPFTGLYSTLRYREEKTTDNTPELVFIHGTSSTDQSVARLTADAALFNEAYSHKYDTFGLDASYSINRYADVTLLAERRNRVHPDPREVTKDHENVLGGGLRLRPMDDASLTLDYKYGQRRMDDTSFVATYEGADRTLLRRYDVADRNQSAFTGTASWSPSERLDLSVTGWWNKDDYLNTNIGLQSVQNTQVFGEAGLHPDARCDLTGGFGYGQMKTDQLGIGATLVNVAANTSGTTTWKNHVDDKNVYAFANASWWAAPKKVQLSLQYTFTRDLQQNQMWDSLTAVQGKNYDLPASFSRTHDVALIARWHYTAAMEFGCRYDYTAYHVDDVLGQTIPNVQVVPWNPNAAAATAFYLGANKLDYTANLIQVFATRRF